MSDLSTANAPYIKKTFDEFRDLTTVTHKKELKCGGFLGGGGVNNEYIFQLRQVKTKEMSNLVLDCSIRAEDWFFARHGKITFNCDQQNVHIPYHESNTNVDHRPSIPANEAGKPLWVARRRVRRYRTG